MTETADPPEGGARDAASLGVTGTAVLLVDDAGRYLLHLRDNIPGIYYPGRWSLIGGGPEGTETPEEAVTREIREEIGLAVPDLRPFALLPEGSGRIQVFLGRWNGDAHALPLTEGVMCHWFTAQLARRLLLSPFAAEAIRRHQQGVAARERE